MLKQMIFKSQFVKIKIGIFALQSQNYYIYWMSLPIIDLLPYLTRQMNTKDLSLQIRDICKKTGFFYIKNHGVPEILQESILKNSATFFALPKQTKRKIQMSKGGKPWRGYFQVGEELTSGKIDLKEGLYLGQELTQQHPLVKKKVALHGRNLFPPQVPELKTDILKWLKEMDRVGGLLMEGIAESLYLDRNYFRQTICKQHLGLLRIFRYPYYENVETGIWGVGEHTDYGLLTILMIMDKGLQVKNVDNQWIKVDPIPNTFVINIGDILQKMTRGLYKSTPHRVMNTEKRSRYSVPYFYDPGWYAQIKELNLKIDQQQAQILKKNNSYKRWDDVNLQTISGTYGDYLLGKVSKVFPHLAEKELS